MGNGMGAATSAGDGARWSIAGSFPERRTAEYVQSREEYSRVGHMEAIRLFCRLRLVLKRCAGRRGSVSFPHPLSFFGMLVKLGLLPVFAGLSIRVPSRAHFVGEKQWLERIVPLQRSIGLAAFALGTVFSDFVLEEDDRARGS